MLGNDDLVSSSTLAVAIFDRLLSAISSVVFGGFSAFGVIGALGSTTSLSSADPAIALMGAAESGGATKL